MATLTIRNLPDPVHQALRKRAAENARSMEAEARDVLKTALKVGPSEEERRKAIADLREMGRRIKATLPEGWSLVDEFLAEKHLEGAWEAGRVTDEERRQWLERLGRYEAQPTELEAFLASRLGTA